MDALDNCAQLPLTLLIAPAGYGKTTLVGDWLETEVPASTPVAWVSLDREDDYPHRLFAYLAGAVENAYPGSMDSTKMLLDSAETVSAENLVTSFVNELAQLQGRLRLVLDDYHVLRSDGVRQSFSVLIEHLPENINVLITTREQPSLPVSRMRARGLAADIQADALEFTIPETRQFLASGPHPEVTDETVHRVHQRTKGWGAGLQLASMAMGQSGKFEFPSDKGSSSDAEDFFAYFAEEIFGNERPEVQEILLNISPLDMIDLDLALAVTGRPETEAILDDLANRNVFITRISSSSVHYRLHPLFAEFLSSRLKQKSPDALIRIRSEASYWFQRQGMNEQAVSYAIAAGDHVRAAELCDDIALWLTAEGRLGRLLAWSRQLPAEVVGQSVGLLVSEAWNAVIHRDFQRATGTLEKIESLIAEHPDPDSEDLIPVRAQCMGMRGFVLVGKGEVQRGLQLNQQARDLIPVAPGFVSGVVDLGLGIALLSSSRIAESTTVLRRAIETSGSPFVIGLAIDTLTRSLSLAGRIREGRAVAEQAVRNAEERSMADVPALAGPHNFIAMAAWETGDLDAARRHVENAVSLARNSELRVYLQWAYATRLGIEIASGDYEAAERAAAELAAFARTLPGTEFAARASALRVRMLLAFGATNEAAIEASRGMPPYESVAQSVGNLLRPWLDTFGYEVLKSWIRLKLALGMADEVQPMIDSLVQWSDNGELNFELMEALLFNAQAAGQAGKYGEVMESLRRSLVLAETGGYVRTLADGGPPLKSLIMRYRRNRPRPKAGEATETYLNRIIDAFPPFQQQDSVSSLTPGASTHKMDGLVEPLTEREQEILSLVANGLSNGDIASRLVVTEGTVKTHINNLYRKLDVRTRAQAIARARELQLA